MVNLLPQKEKNKLRLSYYTRLSTILFVVLSVVFFIGGALLVPSYFLSKNTAESSQRYVLALEETVGLRERDGVTDSMRVLAERVRILKDYGSEKSSAEFFEDILSAKNSKTFITSISFSGGNEMAFKISGVSRDRNSLLSFADALKQNPKISGVNVPVSQLAIDENLPFSIDGVFKQSP